MGKSDSISKDLLQNNDYFADTVNNVLFQGVKVVNPNELVELDTTELTVIEDIAEKSVSIQKYRDVLKQVIIRKDSKAIYVIIGMENQTDIHYAMPVKNFFYDAMRYAKQVQMAAQKHKLERRSHPQSKKNVSKAEFLSGWEKTDKLIPVITLTIYYGTEDWDGARSIHEMFDQDIDSMLLDFVPDYKIHLLEPTKITNWDSFESDIGILYHTIAVSNQDCGIEKLVNSEPEKYRHVDNKIVKAINFYTKSDFQVEEGKGKTDMCVATQTSKEKARIDECIENCIHFNQSLEETVKYVLDRYSSVSESYIIDRYNSLLSV